MFGCGGRRGLGEMVLGKGSMKGFAIGLLVIGALEIAIALIGIAMSVFLGDASNENVSNVVYMWNVLENGAVFVALGLILQRMSIKTPTE
jgi:hypothetical protein